MNHREERAQHTGPLLLLGVSTSRVNRVDFAEGGIMSWVKQQGTLLGRNPACY